MKKLSILLLILFLALPSAAQVAKGRVVVDSLYSKNLENDFGENPTRAVSVYLPPGYDDSNEKYPVIYFLHGFMGNHVIFPQMEEILN